MDMDQVEKPEALTTFIGSRLTVINRRHVVG